MFTPIRNVFGFVPVEVMGCKIPMCGMLKGGLRLPYAGDPGRNRNKIPSAADRHYPGSTCCQTETIPAPPAVTLLYDQRSSRLYESPHCYCPGKIP